MASIDEAKAARRRLFNGIDINGNGYLSLAEVDRGLQDVLQIEEIFDAKPATMRAFQASKNYGGNVHLGMHAADYVEREEFRILLQHLWHRRTFLR